MIFSHIDLSPSLLPSLPLFLKSRKNIPGQGLMKKRSYLKKEKKITIYPYIKINLLNNKTLLSFLSGVIFCHDNHLTVFLSVV